VPQPLFGYCREGRDNTPWIDLQHLVVSVVDDIEVSLAIEGDAIWTTEKIAFGEWRNGAIARNPGDRIAAAVCDVDIARLPVDRYANRAAQAAGDEWRRLTFSINPGDSIAVEIRLQEVAFVVDRVSGCAVEVRRKDVTLAFRRDLPDEIAKVCDIDVPDEIGRYTTGAVAVNNTSKRTDFRLCACRNRRKE